ncbi:hypothetical protein PsorP6_018924 [Peronosclerospora sorghi]|nr:hypothetical protein PsorP6_018924 [Peronosclerospora sorghi]
MIVFIVLVDVGPDWGVWGNPGGNGGLRSNRCQGRNLGRTCSTMGETCSTIGAEEDERPDTLLKSTLQVDLLWFANCQPHSIYHIFVYWPLFPGVLFRSQSCFSTSCWRSFP